MAVFHSLQAAGRSTSATTSGTSQSAESTVSSVSRTGDSD